MEKLKDKIKNRLFKMSIANNKYDLPVKLDKDFFKRENAEKNKMIIRR